MIAERILRYPDYVAEFVSFASEKRRLQLTDIDEVGAVSVFAGYADIDCFISGEIVAELRAIDNAGSQAVIVGDEFSIRLIGTE